MLARYSEAYPLKDHTALIVADKLVNEFICRFGVLPLGRSLNINVLTQCANY
jgi:hypothetical protein